MPSLCLLLGPSYSPTTPTELTESVLRKIAEFADQHIIPDPPRRTGNLGTQKTLDMWEALTIKGRLGQTKTDHDEANDENGSSFKPLICNFHADKQNGAMFHSSSGHTTHFTDSAAGSIRDFMKGCEWQKRVNALPLDME